MDANGRFWLIEPDPDRPRLLNIEKDRVKYLKIIETLFLPDAEKYMGIVRKYQKTMAPTSKVSLIAPCGMNCGICYAYLRVKNTCPGCRGPDDKKAMSCARCKIKNCEVFKNGTVKFCFPCEHFPCDRVKHLDKRYRTKYGMSMIENLKNIEKSGIRSFLKSEMIKWTCPECGGTICVHKKTCTGCEKKF